MPFKGFFKKIKNEIGNEITKQLGGGGGKSSSGGGGDGGAGGSNSGGGGGGGGGAQGFDFAMVGDLIDLVSGGNKGGQTPVQKMLKMVQKYGGILPGDAGKYLPGVLKIAEMFGHGLGDDTPRTQKNADGSIIDDFLKILISGRKIFGGSGGKTVKDTTKKTDDDIGGGGGGGWSGGGGGGRSGGGGFPVGPSYDDDQFDGSTTQDYNALRRQCLQNGVLFEDPEFPAKDSSVFFSNSSRRSIHWRRPGEISGNPSFFVDGASRFDVIQGELGDCWLLAAVANITINENTFRNVVPADNSFEGGQYCGLFHFRFWQYGKWVDIVVDDRLPCDSSGRLLFMHSDDKNEFWSALLEKAYAKLHGSYEALKGGTTCEALVDFTGGVTELYDIQGGPTNLFQMMMKAWERSSFMGCSIEPDPKVLEAETPQGLIRGHAYSITDIKAVEIRTPGRSGTIPLLRIRNPWGNEGEWRGAWADGTPEWQFVQDETKEDLELTFDADGEFWMANKDFQQYFQRVEICNLSPDSLEEDCNTDDGRKKWEVSLYEGSWVRGRTAGGCRNYLDTFAMNPQYLITLIDPDEDDDENKCTVIIGLMQKNRRAQRSQGVDCLTIGFAIYRVDGGGAGGGQLPTQFFKFNASAARSPTFINLREVSCRFKLPPGTYCIVPSTFEPGEEADFVLRVFSETPNHMKANH